MTRPLTEEAREDLLERGFSRRQLARIAAVFGVGASMAAAAGGRPAWAAAGDPPDPDLSARVRLNNNEWWTGPMAPGAAAAVAVIASSNRYNPHGERDALIRTVAQVEGVSEDYVAPWPGSSDPLCRSIVTFCSPAKALVIADPTYELAGMTGEWLGAPVRRVPLTPDLRHDVRAMVAADPSPGVYYICSPNNPTGTVTPLADIEWLVANKPDGSMVLIDEAYIHFAGVPSAARLVKTRSDVIVLRTFSKIFGMAGMRLGYVMTRPEVIDKMMRYDGGQLSGALPIPAVACGAASLTAFDLIAARRREMEEARGLAVEHVRKRGLTVLPSSANMFMIDWKTKAPKEMRAAFRTQGVEIGRDWKAWPTMSRVSVGSIPEMKAFCAALDKVWT